MPESIATILNHSLALFADDLGSTGIIPTTTSLTRWFGYVLLTINTFTITGSSAAPASDLTGFKYQAKSSKSERNLGGCDNKHPTVKPLKLMQWLCRLITPKGGVVLDPFMGSGSTLVAALREGFRAIGIEREAQYVAIARVRITVTEEQQLAGADAAYIDWEALVPPRRATRGQP